MTEDVGQRQDLMDSVRAMLTPARVYLAQQRLKHQSALAIADLAEYVIPMRARELLLRVNLAESNLARDRFRNLLKLVPLVRKESLDINPAAHAQALQRKRVLILSEVDEYLVASEGLPRDFPLTEFWIAREFTLPNLFEFFILMGTLQGSSAHAERVLSRYQRRFGDPNIKDAKEDYVEAAIMSEVNDDEFNEEMRVIVNLDEEEEEEEDE